MSFDNQSFILDDFMILAAATQYFFIAQSTLLVLNSSNLALDHQVSKNNNLVIVLKSTGLEIRS